MADARVAVYSEETVRPNPPQLSIITCHPSSAEIPTLRSSVINNMGMGDLEIVVSVGAESIAAAYNAGARVARGRVLIFTHSDVEIMTSRSMMGQLIENCLLKASGVAGIAGCRVLKESCIWWGQRDQLSGACMHIALDEKRLWMTAFGPYSQAVCLDGVLLACHRDIWEEVGGFDETIPGWDFYDVDFTLRVYLKGYVNSTFPLHVLHHSQGDTSNKPGWHSNRLLMMERYKKYLPVALENRIVTPERKGTPNPPGSGASEQGGQAPGRGEGGTDGKGHTDARGVQDGRPAEDTPKPGAPVGGGADTPVASS